MPAMPVGRILVGFGQCEHPGFPEHLAGKRETRGVALLVKSMRNDDARLAGHVCNQRVHVGDGFGV